MTYYLAISFSPSKQYPNGHLKIRPAQEHSVTSDNVLHVKQGGVWQDEYVTWEFLMTAKSLRSIRQVVEGLQVNPCGFSRERPPEGPASPGNSGIVSTGDHAHNYQTTLPTVP